MKADILRDKFLDFFKSKKHKIIESDSLIPRDDPTVLFTPAGMNQFKRQFLGFDSGFGRAVTCQRCLRTDDLDKVGKTAGHHTFFEMLGNFSFGDYFKEEAIIWAWEFLTKELEIKKDRLWISIYKDDDEAYKIWKGIIKVPKEKILKLGEKENFWPSQAKEKGPNGPCGSCSEIFFDQGANVGCGRADCDPSCKCGRFVEVWNLVFTQFNRKDGGILESLPKKNIDTGMGLERLAAIMQGVYTNFETDLFKPIVKEIVSSIKYQVSSEKESVYAIADHIRAIAFAIYDGVLPSNEARGYVIRKLIRKSIIHLRTMGIKNPFLYKLVPVVSGIMRLPYPELDKRKENIASVILAEEESFILTLNSSGTLLKEKFKDFFKKQDPEKSGVIAFQLYDTYGIPLELTRNWLDKHGIKISQEAFDKELQEQRVRSKLLSAMKGDVFGIKDLVFGIRDTKFLGYKDCITKAKILKIIKDNIEVKKINKNNEAKIILDKTVFYPESGGQIQDTGEFIKGKNIFEVLDTQKAGNIIVHIGKVKEGSFKKQDSILAKINFQRRLSIARNHTATHLLQAALRKVLGAHVKQQGSLVSFDRLRFDFTHFKDIKKDELDRIEEVVNTYIINDYPLLIKKMPLEIAKKQGALAFFGEKYENKVRVVSIGDVSKELCAGTHLASTASVGLFKIIQEGSVASSIRRIEAITGIPAYKAIKKEEKIIEDISLTLGIPKDNVSQEIEKRLAKIKELEKQLNSYRLTSIQTLVDKLKPELINGINVFTCNISNLDMVTLRKIADLVKEKIDNTNSIIISGTGTSNGDLLVLAVTQDLCAKGVDASKLFKEIEAEINGSGGGRPDFAQGGGKKPGSLARVIKKLKTVISQMKL